MWKFSHEPIIWTNYVVHITEVSLGLDCLTSRSQIIIIIIIYNSVRQNPIPLLLPILLAQRYEGQRSTTKKAENFPQDQSQSIINVHVRRRDISRRLLRGRINQATQACIRLHVEFHASARRDERDRLSLSFYRSMVIPRPRGRRKDTSRRRVPRWRNS